MRRLLLALPFVMLLLSGLALTMRNEEGQIELVSDETLEQIGNIFNPAVEEVSQKPKNPASENKSTSGKYKQKNNSYTVSNKQKTFNQKEIDLLNQNIRLKIEIELLNNDPSSAKKLTSQQANKEAMLRINYAKKAKSNFLDLSIPGLKRLPVAIMEVSHIEDLKIKNTQISSFAFLGALKKLKRIDLRGSPVQSLKPFQFIPALELLRLTTENVNLVNAKPVKDVEKLQERVKLDPYAIKDLSVPASYSLAQKIISDAKQNQQRLVDLSIPNLEKIPPSLYDLFYLNELVLRDTKVTSLMGIDDLKRLKKLDITGSPINNIKGLAPLRQLESLAFDSVPAGQLKSFMHDNGLVALKVRDDETHNLDFLLKLKNLKSLDVEGKNLRNIDGLAHSTKLKIVKFKSPSLKNLVALKSMFHLDEVYLDAPRLSDIRPLTAMKSLKSLTLKSSFIYDYSPLEDLYRLKKLVLENHKKRSFKLSSEMVSLQHFELYADNLVDIYFDSFAYNIERLKIVAPKMNYYWGVRKLSKLKSIYLHTPQIVTIDEITGLEDLEHITLRDLRLDRLDGIENLPQLKSVTLSNMRLDSLLPLALNKNIENILLHKVSVTDPYSLGKRRSYINLTLAEIENEIVAYFKLLKYFNVVYTDVSRAELFRGIDQRFLKPRLSKLKPQVKHSQKSKAKTSIRGEKLEFIDKVPLDSRRLVLASPDLDYLPSNLGRLKNVENLTILSANLKSLKGIESLPKLRRLTVPNANITNFLPLVRLTNLETADFSSSYVKNKEDLSFLQGVEITLSNQKILNGKQRQPKEIVVIQQTKLEFVKSADKLEYGDANSFILNKSPIKTKELTLAHFRLAHIPNSIRRLENLEQLTIKSSQLKSLAGIEGLRKLKRLTISNAKIKNLAPLRGLENLIEIDLPKSIIRSFNPLKNLIKMRKITVGGMEGVDLTVLGDMPELLSISIGKSDVRDLKPLAKNKKLLSLKLQSRHLQNVSPINKLKHLYKLDLNAPKLKNAKSLASLFELKELTLRKTRVEDIRFTQNLRKLKHFTVEGGALQDISPLRLLHNLRSVELIDSWVRDVSPLKHVKKLRKLILVKNPISNLDSLRHLEDLKVDIRRN